MIRYFLIDASLPASFWLDAPYAAIFTINRLPTPILDDKSPYEVFFKKIPDYKFLKLGGCVCFPHLFSANKLSPRFLARVFFATPLTIRDIAVLIPLLTVFILVIM